MKEEYKSPVAILSLLHPTDVLASSSEPPSLGGTGDAPNNPDTPNQPADSDPASPDLDWD